ncbi:hypothetical protein P7C73_g2435, partial [Tremellales sp. Uapishka_1]
MSSYPQASSSSQPMLLPPKYAESKRDKKRRETVNKIELLHDESWRNRDEKFSALYKEYHLENKAVNVQPPTSSKYLLRLYPITIERDALLESAEVDYQYKAGLAKKLYESERESIEAQYWEARDQSRQRLLGAIEERRRKLREEKEGGDVVTETLLEAQTRPRPSRRLHSRARPTDSPTPNTHAIRRRSSTSPSGIKPNDLLLHSLLAPSLATIGTNDIISSHSSSLAIIPPVNPASAYTAAPTGKRGPRGKEDLTKEDRISNAPGTQTSLAIASGQQAPSTTVNGVKGSRGAGGVQGQWVLGKSLAEMKKMESASQLEMESDWARIQGGTGRRGRRGAD